MIKIMISKTEHKTNRCKTVKDIAIEKTQSRLASVPVFVVVMVLVVFHICSISFASGWSMHDILKGYLLDTYPWDNIEISDIKVIGELHDTAPEKITVEKGPIGKAIFLLNFEKGDRVVAKANIKTYDWIVMSKRPLMKGHMISDDDLYVVKKDISRMPRNAVRNKDMIIGKSLKRSIVANIPVVENMINKHQVVKRGKMVKLLIGNEDFSVSATGKTKEKGYVGKSVRAINVSSKKVVIGVLIDERTVRVDM